jgi:hypothetical protein
LREFPPDLISRLYKIDQAEVAKRWAAEMPTAEHTHSVTGEKLYEGWTTEPASQISGSIVSLARKAIHGQRMYFQI